MILKPYIHKKLQVPTGNFGIYARNLKLVQSGNLTSDIKSLDPKTIKVSGNFHIYARNLRNPTT